MIPDSPPSRMQSVSEMSTCYFILVMDGLLILYCHQNLADERVVHVVK